MINTSFFNKILGSSNNTLVQPQIIQTQSSVLLEDKTPVSNLTNSSDTFTQNVIQTLQNLGINTENLSSEALQTFSQNLYSSLSQKNNGVESEPVLTSVNNLNVSSGNESLKISGGTNLKYVVDFSQAELGDYLPHVMASVKTALENIGQYVGSGATFNLKVTSKYDDSPMLAQTSTPIIETKDNPYNTNADTIFIADTVRGFDFNPETNDAELAINLSKIDQMAFSGKPELDKYDFTSIMTHEILHGLAFTGALDTETDYKTAYDGLVSKDAEGSPIFVGRHAKTANLGQPVPLSPTKEGSGSAYYHVAIPNDLMSPTLKKGEVKTISALDLAMLQDMGISVKNVALENPKFNNVYNTGTLLNPTNANTLQNDFINLVQPLSTTDLANSDLKNFLVSFSNNNPNSVGLSFSVSV